MAPHRLRPPRPPQGLVSVEVVASVTQPERFNSYTTNTFTFVFAVEWPEARGGLPAILPESKEEAERMRRHLLDGDD